MITPFIFILFILVIIFYQMGKIKLTKISFLTAVALFFMVGSGAVPAALLNHLEVPFYKSHENVNWGKRNAIILVGAGNVIQPGTGLIKPTIFSYSRISRAASLYFDCLKGGNQCRLILSGGDPLHTGKSEAQVYKEELLTLGVNASNIILEPNSNNTYKNAQLVSKILQAEKFDSLLLVTSGIHIKRTALYFSNFGFNPKPIVADYIKPQISIIPLGYNFAVTDMTLHEYVGIARLYVYNYMGWNAKN
jgi:uncharacterized SAM-binding protein YcdF (DUF218 family)